jgi:hypothetical protein
MQLKVTKTRTRHCSPRIRCYSRIPRLCQMLLKDITARIRWIRYCSLINRLWFDAAQGYNDSNPILCMDTTARIRFWSMIHHSWSVHLKSTLCNDKGFSILWLLKLWPLMCMSWTRGFKRNLFFYTNGQDQMVLMDIKARIRCWSRIQLPG